MAENKIFWDVTTIREFSMETKDVEIQGKWVTIKKLPCSIINGNTGDNTDLIVKGLVNPKLTSEQVQNLSVDLGGQIIKAITEFSSLPQSDAEKN